MKAKVVVFILFAVILALLHAPVYAQAVPSLPHAFYGTIEINGELAPVGTEVEARGEGVQIGVSGNPVVTTEEGIFGSVSNPLEPQLIVQGELADRAALTFYVNDVSTGQTAEWHSGEMTEVDLAVSIEGPPPGTTCRARS